MNGRARVSKPKLAAASLSSSLRRRRDIASVSLTVQYAMQDDSLPTRQQFRKWVKAALERDADVTVRIVDAEEGQHLNRQYRGKNYPTNVLTFEYGEPVAKMPLAGDIVLCAPVVASEAQEQGQDLLSHYAHLTVHGTLHMQGYRHETEPEAEAMESLEAKILATLGYPNPYESKDKVGRIEDE
jgi:probable rRNA maturation factor